MSRDDFYPELSEAGAKEAQALIDSFKVAMHKAADEVLGKLYCDVAIHIESDSWTNYRNKLVSAFSGYGDSLTHHEYDFKSLREGIFKQFKDEILRDLNQDNLREIESLKKQVADLHEMRRY